MKLDPLGDGISSVGYVQHSGDDLMNANAARVSLAGFDEWSVTRMMDDEGAHTFRNLPDRSKKLLRYLIRHGHWSPFEHSYLTIRINAPIFVRTQVYRHWSIKPNEVSGRYVELKDQWFVPKVGEFRKQAPSNRQASVADDGTIDQESAHTIYADACEYAYRAYQRLLQIGVTREQARGVLTQSHFTEFFFTGSVRSWLHFFSARIHEGAQLETQLFAEAIREVFRAYYPETLAAYLEVEAEKAEDAEFAWRYRELQK